MMKQATTPEGDAKIVLKACLASRPHRPFSQREAS